MHRWQDARVGRGVPGERRANLTSRQHRPISSDYVSSEKVLLLEGEPRPTPTRKILALPSYRAREAGDKGEGSVCSAMYGHNT